mgnify:CR=1 FL=1
MCSSYDDEYGEPDGDGNFKPKRVWPDEKVLRRRLMSLLHSIAVGDMGKRPEPKKPGPAKKVQPQTALPCCPSCKRG